MRIVVNNKIEIGDYVMGVDSFNGGHAICVAQKTGSGMIVKFLRSFDSEEKFNDEIDRASEFYNIPDNRIFKER